MSTWVEPYTDWNRSDYCTYDDMNRIFGNINYVASTSLKETWAQNDIVSLSDFNSAITALRTMGASLGITVPLSTSTTATADANEFNTIESYTLQIKTRLDLIAAQNIANIYSGDGLYSDDGIENYVRGA